MCSYDELNWFLWDHLESGKDFYRFYKTLIHFRKEHAWLFDRVSFLHAQDIDWHGCQPFKPEWNRQTFIAFTLKDLKEGRHLYAAFNAQNHPIAVKLPAPPAGLWHWVVNTGNVSPHDIFEVGQRPLVKEASQTLLPFSAILLEALAAEGVRPREAAWTLKRHPFYVEKVFGQAENFTEDELRTAVVRMSELDHALKGGSKLRRISSSSAR